MRNTIFGENRSASPKDREPGDDVLAFALAGPGANSSASAGRRQRRASRRTRLCAEAIESRILLTGNVQGQVFRDYNANGAIDALEPGVGNVTVTAFDDTNSEVASTTTSPAAATLGQYNLAIPGSTTRVRLVFTPPPGFEAGPIGPDSNTAVQFADTAGGTVTGFSLGLARPGDFSSSDPLLVTSRFVFGDQLTGSFNNLDTVVAFNYNSQGNSPSPTTVARANQVGTTWGLAYDVQEQRIFAAAYLKSNAGFGPSGPGAIYRINIADINNPAISTYVDINTIFPGAAGSDRANGTNYFFDSGTFGSVGKSAFGGLDISEDGSTLFGMNLADRQLYEIPTSGTLDATTIRRTLIPDPTNGQRFGDVRAFAVKQQDGLVYVGLIDTAQSTQDRDDLMAYVYTFNPVTHTFSAAPVLSFPLNFERGEALNGTLSANWRPWTDTFNPNLLTDATPGPFFEPTAGLRGGSFSQPILSDIDFDNGAMVIGFRDRFGDQIGNGVGNPTDSNDTTLYYSIAVGDLMRAAPNGAGGWTIESNGSSGGVTTGGAGDKNGPGGGEYYHEDFFRLDQNVRLHDEIAMGGIEQIAGFGTVASTTIDPTTNIDSGGIRRFFNANGRASTGNLPPVAASDIEGYQIYLTPGPGSFTFGKSNGLGDLEAAVEIPPIEIGNRIFRDTNANGIQDASEPGIANVAVVLFQGATQIGGATTDANGVYRFGGLNGLNLNPGVKLLPDTTYQVQIAPASGLGSPTPANQGTNPEINSKVVLSNGSPVINVTTGGAGQNAHAFDAGFIVASSLAGSVYVDDNNNGVREAGEAGINGVTVTLTGKTILGVPVNLSTVTGKIDGVDGAFEFLGIEASDASGYTLVETQPAGFLDGLDTAGSLGGDSITINDKISNILVNSGDQGVKYLFGELVPAQIAGSVYVDENNDGDRQGTEAGIPSATVALTGTDDLGNAVNRQTTTDANGNYSFGNLRPGVYVLDETQPAGFDDGKDKAGSLGGDASVNDRISKITVESGDNGVNYLFGELRVVQPNPASVAGNVYVDANNDGIRQGGEAGIPGVTVILTGTDGQGNPVNQQTTTDGTGAYIFKNLQPGTYTVSETQPAGFNDGKETVGNLGGDATVNDKISAIKLNAGDAGTEYNFGELNIVQPNPASIAGNVYVDDNNDGVRQAGEAGIPGTTVTLTGADDKGNPVNQQTTTDANGAYIFSNLQPGTYVVTETQPAGFNDGKDTAGSLGGDATVNDKISAIKVNAGDAGKDYNFGELKIVQPNPASVAGNVYVDANNDGIRQGGEAGIPGVTITLTGTDDSGNPVNQQTTTDGTGAYIFKNLQPGTYTVAETQPAGFNDGKETVGNLGGDVTVNDKISAIKLNSGDAGTEYNFGELNIVQPNPASIAGNVYVDANNDGIRQGGEAGIPGVTVILTGTDGQGNPVNQQTTTDGTGAYIFKNLQPGTYTVSETQPVGFNDGKETVGNLGGDASVNDKISAIKLNAGDAGTEYNFGELTIPTELASIAGNVYVDDNNDGVRQGGEAGIPGTTVALTGTDDKGNPVNQQTTTDANGAYVFKNLQPGTYVVTETQPAGFNDGKDTPGSLGGDASVNDKISAIKLNAGNAGTDYNFGELKIVQPNPASVAGNVYVDANNDGIRQGGEAGIPGVTITLTGTDGQGNPVNQQTTTDGTGAYIFKNLQPGTYTVSETQPAGFDDGKETVGNLGGDAAVNDKISAIKLNAGDAGTEYNFGELNIVQPNPASIAGNVYEDKNDDGVRQAGEAGIPGVTVILTGTDNAGGSVNLTTTTGGDGSYKFSNLQPGTYSVSETQPAGFLDGKEAPGSLGGDASVNDKISTIKISAGDAGTEYNFGEVRPGQIKGNVYLDDDDDGVFDDDELGIPDVTVVLTGTDNRGNAVNLTTTTDDDGGYSFSNLFPGTYAVTETQPPEFNDGKDTAGNLGGDAAVNDKISNIKVNSGDIGSDYNFGERETATLSGLVYFDKNNNGIAEAGEAGIPGVTVILTGTDDFGDPVNLTTTTGPDGKYAFPDLFPGVYTVTETQPAGFNDGKETAGNLGGDITVNDKISNITISAKDGTGYNFGEIQPPGVGSISGLVFVDANNDGVPQAGEAGIPGVTVTLTGTDDSGNPVSLTTTTGGDGTYLFGNLVPGTYAVTETQPAGFTDGKDTAGTLGGDAAVNDKISAIKVNAGDAGTGYNFAEITDGGGGGDKNSSIAGTVFVDPNNNGLQDPGDAGIPGVTITLTGTDGQGNPVNLQTTTDANGDYQFDKLAAGTYVVTETQPVGFRQGRNSAGSNGGTVVGDVISAIAIPEGKDLIEYNFAERPALSPCLSGFIFVDTNDNGVLDGGETPVANAIVVLSGVDINGQPTSDFVARSNAQGFYHFSNVPPGIYSARLIVPRGFAADEPFVGTNVVPGGSPSSGVVASPVQLSQLQLFDGDDLRNYNFTVQNASAQAQGAAVSRAAARAAKLASASAARVNSAATATATATVKTSRVNANAAAASAVRSRASALRAARAQVQAQASEAAKASASSQQSSTAKKTQKINSAKAAKLQALKAQALAKAGQTMGKTHARVLSRALGKMR